MVHHNGAPADPGATAPVASCDFDGANQRHITRTHTTCALPTSRPSFPYHDRAPRSARPRTRVPGTRPTFTSTKGAHTNTPSSTPPQLSTLLPLAFLFLFKDFNEELVRIRRRPQQQPPPHTYPVKLHIRSKTTTRAPSSRVVAPRPRHLVGRHSPLLRLTRARLV